MAFDEVHTGTKPIVEAVKDFDEISSILLLKMAKTIERFEASSSKVSKRMLWLTLAIAVLTIVMILIMIFGNN